MKERAATPGGHKLRAIGGLIAAVMMGISGKQGKREADTLASELG